jgi:hypothetical protein
MPVLTTRRCIVVRFTANAHVFRTLAFLRQPTTARNRNTRLRRDSGTLEGTLLNNPATPKIRFEKFRIPGAMICSGKALVGKAKKIHSSDSKSAFLGVLVGARWRRRRSDADGWCPGYPRKVES